MPPHFKLRPAPPASSPDGSCGGRRRSCGSRRAWRPCPARTPAPGTLGRRRLVGGRTSRRSARSALALGLERGEHAAVAERCALVWRARLAADFVLAMSKKRNRDEKGCQAAASAAALSTGFLAARNAFTTNPSPTGCRLSPHVAAVDRWTPVVADGGAPTGGLAFFLALASSAACFAEQLGRRARPFLLARRAPWLRRDGRRHLPRRGSRWSSWSWRRRPSCRRRRAPSPPSRWRRRCTRRRGRGHRGRRRGRRLEDVRGDGLVLRRVDDLHARADLHHVVKLDHVPRTHPDAPVARRPADVALLGRAVDVDAARERLRVARLPAPSTPGCA